MLSWAWKKCYNLGAWSRNRIFLTVSYFRVFLAHKDQSVKNLLFKSEDKSGNHLSEYLM